MLCSALPLPCNEYVNMDLNILILFLGEVVPLVLKNNSRIILGSNLKNLRGLKLSDSSDILVQSLACEDCGSSELQKVYWGSFIFNTLSCVLV